MARFVGRDAALAQASRCLGSRSPGAVVVAGVRGSGRTRFLTELAEELRDAGRDVRVLRATATDLGDPLGSLAGSELPTDTDAAIAWMATRDRITLVDGGEHLDRTAALAVLRAVERGGRVGVTVDSGADVPDPLVAVWRDELATRLVLELLDRDQVAELLRTELDGTVSDQLIGYAWERTRGYPDALVDLVRSGTAAGAIAASDGLHTSTATIEPTASYIQQVGSVLASLPPAQRTAAEVVAVADGVPIGTSELAGPDEALDALSDRGLLVVEDEAIELWPPHRAAAARATVAATRRRRILQTLADAHEPSLTDHPRTLRAVARWRLEIGRPVDRAVALEVARRAMAELDASTAVELLADAPATDAPAQLVLGSALIALRRGREAERALTAAWDHAEDPETRTEATLAHAHHLIMEARRPDEARELIERTRDHVDAPSLLDQLDAVEALADATMADTAAAAACGDRVLARGQADPVTLVTVLHISTVAKLLMARGLSAIDDISHTDGLLDVARPVVPLPTALLELNRGMALLWSGRLEETRALVTEQLSQVSAADGVTALWSWIGSEVELLAGDLDEAERLATEAIHGTSVSDPVGAADGTHAVRAVIRAHRRDSAGTRADVDAIPDRPVSPASPAVGVQHRARAWATSLERGAAQAAESALEAGAWGLEHGVLTWAAVYLHDAVRFGHPEGAVAPLRRIADGAEGELIPAFADHAVALQRGDVDGLRRVTERFERMGADLLAAEAAAQAARLSPDADRVRASAWASTYARRCPGAVTPALATLAGESEPLTSRESEIAMLAADGRTAREVAERLVISHRTVENHLANVYRKLGIRTREELAVALTRDGSR